MEELSKKFLNKVSRRYDLSAEQQEAFIALYSTDKTQQEIAEALHISNSALRTRMTGVSKIQLYR